MLILLVPIYTGRPCKYVHYRRGALFLANMVYQQWQLMRWVEMVV